MENGERERESERFEVLREKNASPSAIYQRDTRVRPNHCWPTSSILRNPPPTHPTPRKDNLMLAPINAETTTFPALLPRCPTSEIRTNLRISRITLQGREERKERGTRSACFLSMPGRKNVLKKRNAYLNSSIPRIALGRRGNPRIRSV